MDEFIMKDSSQNVADSNFIMNQVEMVVQQKYNLLVPALMIELSNDADDWDYDDLYDVLESFGEVDMLETNNEVAVVLFKKFLDALTTLEFLKDNFNFKKDPLETLNIRWYIKEDEGIISKSFKRKIQSFIEKNLLQKEKECCNPFDKQIFPQPNNQLNSFPKNNNNNTNNSIYSNLGYMNNYEMVNNSNIYNNNSNTTYNGNNFNNLNYNNYNNNFNGNYNNNVNNIYSNSPNSLHLPHSTGQFYQKISDFNPNINEIPLNKYINNSSCKDYSLFANMNINQHKYSYSNMPSFILQDQAAKRKSSNKTSDAKEKEKTSNEKYTCKFEIQIENDNEFQVCRKLIGSKGCNMKNIVDICKGNSMLNITEPVKLRLRGKGSGYKEGPEQKESEESLHLCVSSKYQDTYYLACKLVEDLIIQLYDEYRKFSEKKGLNLPHLVIRKTEGDHTSVNYNMTRSTKINF